MSPVRRHSYLRVIERSMFFSYSGVRIAASSKEKEISVYNEVGEKVNALLQSKGLLPSSVRVELKGPIGFFLHFSWQCCGEALDGMGVYGVASRFIRIHCSRLLEACK